MLNLLLADWYRTRRSRTFWCGVAVLIAAGLWSGLGTAARAQGQLPASFALYSQGSAPSTNAAATSLTTAWGQTLLSGSLLTTVAPLLACAAASYDLTSRLDTVLSCGTCRSPLHAIEHALFAASLALACLAAGAISYLLPVILVSSTALNFEATPQVVAWVLLAWLHVSAYACLGSAVIYVTHKPVAGIACVAIVGTGFLGMLAASASAATGASVLDAVSSLPIPYAAGQVLTLGAQALFDPSGAGIPLTTPWLRVLAIDGTFLAITVLASCLVASRRSL